MIADRTYLDYNATAPLVPEAREAILSALDITGNPSSVHAEGRRARAIIDDARSAVAELVHAKPSEVVFTSGATEANAWALTGKSGFTAVSGIEHDSVHAPLQAASVRTFDVPVGVDGVAQLEALADVSGIGALVLQWANNETGIVQPIWKAAALAHEKGWTFHTDAVQAAGRLPIDFASLGATTLSLSAHKLGGPKGIGALVVRDGVNLRPLIAGGGQERRRRGGTENVAGIAGFGAAAIVAQRRLSEWKRVAALRDEMERELRRITPAAVVIGSASERLPNTTCVALAGYAAETMVIKFDLAGYAISAGAACSSGKVGSSHVLSAMGLHPDLARSAIRISLGLETSRENVAGFIEGWRTITKSHSAEQKVA
jgi:cysteine desulfurase